MINRQQIVKFVWDNFFLRYHVNPSDVKEFESRLEIQREFVLTELKGIQDLSVNYWEKKGEKLPYILAQNKPNSFEIIHEKAYFNFDVFAAVFFFLSAYQEVRWPFKSDALGRFPYQASIQSHMQCAHLPLVDYYYEDLYQALQALGYSVSPKQQRARLRLSHDVDNIYGFKQDALFALKKFKVRGLLALAFRKIRHGDDWKNLMEIAQLEAQYGFKSIFYFLVKRTKYKTWPNADYSIHHPYIKAVMVKLCGMGSSIGLHASLGTYQSAQQLQTERELLSNNRENRFHFLHYTYVDAVKNLELAGISEDSSMGFAEQPGFRMATALPFKPFNWEESRAANFLEYPLVLMDTTLKQYLKLNSTEAKKELDTLIYQVKKVKGNLCVLWHNNYFTNLKFKPWKSVYIYLLKKCSEAEFNDDFQAKQTIEL